MALSAAVHEAAEQIANAALARVTDPSGNHVRVVRCANCHRRRTNALIRAA